MRLLRRYVELGSQEAFADLVRKHLSWVYSSCRRALRDPHLAEDAAQAVFIVLARRAETISPETRLAGWLFNTARFVVKDSKKARSRYLRREEIARQVAAERTGGLRNGRHNGNGNGNGHSHGNGNGYGHAALDATQQAMLDDGLASLSERDRQALIMHFYEGLTLQQMAEALEIGKEGAKKRVGRALARLRQKLGAKGVFKGIGAKGRTGLSIVTVALLLRAQSAWALPSGLARRTIESVAGGGAGVGAGAGMASWLADWTVGAGARASWRLMRAALAVQVVAAVTVTMVLLWPSSTGSRVSSKSNSSSRSPDEVALAPGGSGTGGSWGRGAFWTGTREGDGTPQAPSFVTTTTNDPPYRSGADEPEQRPVNPTPSPSPVPASKAGAEVAAKTGTENPGDDGAPVAGSSYAGLPPVVRGVSAEVVYEPPTPGPVKLDGMPHPPLPFGAVGSGGGDGPRSSKRSKEVAGPPKPGSGTGSGEQPGVDGGMPVTPVGTDGQIATGNPANANAVGAPGTQVVDTGNSTGTTVVHGVDPAMMMNSSPVTHAGMPAPPPGMVETGSVAMGGTGKEPPPSLGMEPGEMFQRPGELPPGARPGVDPGMGRGPQQPGNGIGGKVSRSTEDPDELVDGVLKDKKKSRRPPPKIGGVKAFEWAQKVKQRESRRPAWDRDGDDGHGEPLTIIGGRPIPIDILPKHPIGAGAGLHDGPSFLMPGSASGSGSMLLPGDWRRPSLDDATFHQVPEPGGLGVLTLGFGGILLRRRSRR